MQSETLSLKVLCVRIPSGTCMFVHVPCYAMLFLERNTTGMSHTTFSVSIHHS